MHTVYVAAKYTPQLYMYCMSMCNYAPVNSHTCLLLGIGTAAKHRTVIDELL